MKKVLSLVLVLALAATSFAQKHSKDLRIGFKIEPNISWFNPVENGVKGDGSKAGINYGLMVDYEFADNYIFSTGLQVSHLGGKLSYVGNNTGYAGATPQAATNVANYNLSIQYIEVPFTIKLRTSNKGKMDYWANFGGFLAVPVKARADYQTNFSAGSMDNVNVISGVQPINIGMQLGGGVELPISDKNSLVLGLVYNNGFIDVTKNGNWGGDGRINLNSMALKLGIFF